MTSFDPSAFFRLARTGLKLMVEPFLELLGPLVGDKGGGWWWRKYLWNGKIIDKGAVRFRKLENLTCDPLENGEGYELANCRGYSLQDNKWSIQCTSSYLSPFSKGSQVRFLKWRKRTAPFDLILPGFVTNSRSKDWRILKTGGRHLEYLNGPKIRCNWSVSMKKYWYLHGSTAKNIFL